MDFSTQTYDRAQGRELLTSVIVPRPMAWISSAFGVGSGGFNLAPFSSIGTVCNQPPMLSFCCGRRFDGSQKHTSRNVHASGEFVVNFVHPSLLEQLCLSAEEHDSTVNEFVQVGVTPGPCRVVKAPRVIEAQASLECQLFKSLEVGDGDARVDLFIGRIVHVHLSEDRVEGKCRQYASKITLLAALGLDWYLVEGKTKFRPQPILVSE
jgi:flavin reductase (DIM6/NTAB) family NADH-FMN oxidoreductase RutF